MPNWFAVVAVLAHRGRDSEDTTTNFVWAEDAGDAFSKAQTLRGVKRGRTPTITELSEEGGRALEMIIEESPINLNSAREGGFYGDDPRDYRRAQGVRRMLAQEEERKLGGGIEGNK